MKVEGKVVVVTGGASGIGRALCERFAREGARGVVVADQNGGGAETVAKGIGKSAVGVGCDVSSARDNEELVRRAEGAFGPVDLFCCNAGIATGGDPLETPLDVWQRQWDVNLMAHVHALRAALPGMLARGSGYFVHTASMAGILSTHGNLVYAVTKHAVVGLAEWLSITYHDRGVHFSCLCPLGVRTPMLGDVDTPWAKAAAGPIREPEEVAQNVVDGLAEERFLILTDPQAQAWMDGKAKDPERWLRGMRRLQITLDQARSSSPRTP
jgi:NAD(P)-dependent dehydrogenase (short-subunit alcohol dehydrogenase family)